jgi:hypothetical protein
MRRTVLKIKAEGAMSTSEASMTPIKGANVTSMAGGTRHGGERVANHGGGRARQHGADQEVEQPRGDLRDHLSTNLNLRDCIENNREECHASEMQRRQEYDEAHGAPCRGYAPRASHILGLRPFTDRLHAIIWPRNIKLHDLDTYDGKANPEQWITLYEIAV